MLELSLTGSHCPPDERKVALERWLEPLVVTVAPAASSLSVALVDDAEMRRLNERFRAQDRATDVLSFPGGETLEGCHLGDIVIAVPYAERQAREQGHDLDRELRILLLHGVLHCLGHDHEADEGQMEELEQRLRREWIMMRENDTINEHGAIEGDTAIEGSAIEGSAIEGNTAGATVGAVESEPAPGQDRR